MVILMGDLYDSVVGFKAAGKEKFDLQAEEVAIWAKAIAEAMIQAI